MPGRYQMRSLTRFVCFALIFTAPLAGVVWRLRPHTVAVVRVVSSETQSAPSTAASVSDTSNVSGGGDNGMAAQPSYVSPQDFAAALARNQWWIDQLSSGTATIRDSQGRPQIVPNDPD